MNNNNRKRKHFGSTSTSGTRYHHQTPPPQFRDHDHDDSGFTTAEQTPYQDPLQALYFRAYEADIVHGPRAQAAIRSLGVDLHTGKPIQATGSALIQWGAGAGVGAGGSHAAQAHGAPGIPKKVYGVVDNDEFNEIPDAKAASGGDDTSSEIWVDRYDARLLLDALPSTLTSTSLPRPDTPTGWSDLDSDSEDTFFFTPDELTEFQRQKRRKTMEKAREDRIKALEAEESLAITSDGVGDDPWGGSDEEADEPQKQLMHLTATHFLSADNPAQLEMRILANYGADKRFAFLRGRWSRTWRIVKAKARLEKEKEKEKGKGGLGLVGYGSDSEAEESESEAEALEQVEALEQDTVVEAPEKVATDVDTTKGSEKEKEPAKDDDEVIKEARRQRAKAWAEKRKKLNPK